MTTSNKKVTNRKVSKSAIEFLVNEFYNLRQSFEANYSGKLRSHKYEATRDFTIALNHAIFKANQVLSENILNFESATNLESLLENLRNDFHFLKS